MTPPATAAAAPAVRPNRRPEPARAPRARPAAAPRRRPRRVSGPARRSLRAVQAAENLANHRLLDRLVRSRLWIGLVAFALIGIVAMQLWVLKLNSGIGRAIEHEAYLQRTNAQLSIENSSVIAGDGIEQAANALGMQYVAPGTLRFLHARPGSDERLAAARLAAPPPPPAPAPAEPAPVTETTTIAPEATATSEPSASSEAPTPTASAPTTEATSTTPSSEPAAPSREAAAVGASAEAPPAGPQG